jgi:hypothetical protein
MDLFQLSTSRFSHQSLFYKTKKELPLVALFHQEKMKLIKKMLSVAIWGKIDL